MSEAPLHFTQDFYTPDQLRAAYDRWTKKNDLLGAAIKSHMWNQIGSHGYVELDGHRCELFTAHLETGFVHGGWGSDGEIRRYREGPGGILHQSICTPCQWNTIGTEAEVVEAWHDHALPGWRALPVVPDHIRVRTEKGPTKAMLTWIQDHYPAEAQQPGHPIRTERTFPGTRHVQGYSPWGGYDLAVIREPKPQLSAPPPPTGLPSSAEQTELF